MYLSCSNDRKAWRAAIWWPQILDPLQGPEDGRPFLSRPAKSPLSCVAFQPAYNILRTFGSVAVGCCCLRAIFTLFSHIGLFDGRYIRFVIAGKWSTLLIASVAACFPLKRRSKSCLGPAGSDSVGPGNEVECHHYLGYLITPVCFLLGYDKNPPRMLT